MAKSDENDAVARYNCPECEKAMFNFENEAFTIEHQGLKAIVKGLSGRRCGSCGEVEFDAKSAQKFADVSDSLVLKDRASRDIISRYRSTLRALSK